jgi:hypothetical protein
LDFPYLLLNIIMCSSPARPRKKTALIMYFFLCASLLFDMGLSLLENLALRYGNPIIILNLIKASAASLLFDVNVLTYAYIVTDFYS